MPAKPSDFSHLVVGGGVVGLAIAARLARTSSNSVLLVERHSAVGTETSARNSEVIHAGLYHPLTSLRTKLCIRGKHLLYDVGAKYGVEMRSCGKWIVAQDEAQHKFLDTMFRRAKDSGVPLEWVPLSKAAELEPAVIAREAVVNSPTTGIVSAHSLMDYLAGEIESNGADIATNTKVTAIAPASGKGYLVECETGGQTPDEPASRSTVKSDFIINCAGLSAPLVSNMLLPKDRWLSAYYAKGNYYSYTASKPTVSRLVYPCPTDHASLGTHLTIDLAGRIRFGPDLEWVESPEDLEASSTNLESAKRQIANYIDIDLDALVPDYAGIRPKIVSDGSKFQDFVIRQEEGFPGFVNLLNIESPGLTASLAIAEYVEMLID